jgi:hypothetical protein
LRLAGQARAGGTQFGSLGGTWRTSLAYSANVGELNEVRESTAMRLRLEDVCDAAEVVGRVRRQRHRRDDDELEADPLVGEDRPSAPAYSTTRGEKQCADAIGVHVPPRPASTWPRSSPAVGRRRRSARRSLRCDQRR